MRLYPVLALALALGIAAVALFIATEPPAGKKKVVDELGETHTVILVDTYAIIKHEPYAHQADKNFDKMTAYIKARQESWNRWKKLIDKYGNETYIAYVVPCRIYTIEEFIDLANRLGVSNKIVKVVFYNYYKNGTYASMGVAGLEMGEDLKRRLEEERTFNYMSVGRHILLLRNATLREKWLRGEFNFTEAVEVGRAHVDIYVGAFVVNATLKELYELAQKEEVLMVDTPLDLIWRYREGGYKVEVKRLTYGDLYFDVYPGRDKDLCRLKRG